MVSIGLRMASLYPLTHPKIFLCFSRKLLTFYEPPCTMWMFLLLLSRRSPVCCSVLSRFSDLAVGLNGVIGCIPAFSHPPSRA